MEDGITFLGRIIRAWRRRSLGDFTRLALYNLQLLCTGQYRKANYAFDTSFDRQFNVETAGTEAVEYLTGEQSVKKHATPYEPVTVEQMRALIEMLPPMEADTFAFVDLGSGKGRALFLAAEYPFRKIVGVEYAPELHEVALRNSRTYRNPAQKCRDIQPVCADATTFAFPHLPTVCFMNNPFAESLIAEVAQRIDDSVRSVPRPFFIVYLHSNHTGPIDRMTGWTRFADGQLGKSPYALWYWNGDVGGTV